MTTTSVATDRPARMRCSHLNQQSTVHAGLKRVVCGTCKQVHVDFVNYAGAGTLFRIPRRR